MNWTGYEIDELIDAFLDAQGKIMINLRWYGFEHEVLLPAEDVVHGAHLLLKSLLVKKGRSIDKVVADELERLIFRLEKEIRSKNVKRSSSA